MFAQLCEFISFVGLDWYVLAVYGDVFLIPLPMLFEADAELF